MRKTEIKIGDTILQPFVNELNTAFWRMESWVKPAKRVHDGTASLYADKIDAELVVYNGPREDYDCGFEELCYEMNTIDFIPYLVARRRVDDEYKHLHEATVTYYDVNKFDGKDAINWNCDVINKSGPIIMVEWPSRKRWLGRHWPKNQLYIRNSTYWHKHDGDEGGPHYEEE